MSDIKATAARWREMRAQPYLTPADTFELVELGDDMAEYLTANELDGPADPASV